MNKILSSKSALVLMLALTLFAGATSAVAGSWKFAVLCDSRSSYSTDGLPDYFESTYGISPYFQNVALALSRERDLDFVLFPGDLFRGKKPTMTGAQMAAALEKWNSFMAPVYSANIPVYLIRGNHDASEVTDPAGPNGNAVTIWRNHMNLYGNSVNPIVVDTGDQSGLTYAFAHKGSLFIGLDEYTGGWTTTGLLSYDQAFLNTQLARRAQHRFVFAHQPLWNYKASELGQTGFAAGLANDLNSSNIDLFFSGHIHSYQRIREDGYYFQEMILGTAGAPEDNPTLDSTGPGYVPDPNLFLKNYIGGTSANARFGYAIITVNDDGSISSTLKLLDRPSSASSTVSSFDGFRLRYHESEEDNSDDHDSNHGR